MPNIVQDWGYVGLETVLATPPLSVTSPHALCKAQSKGWAKVSN